MRGKRGDRVAAGDGAGRVHWRAVSGGDLAAWADVGRQAAARAGRGLRAGHAPSASAIDGASLVQDLGFAALGDQLADRLKLDKADVTVRSVLGDKINESCKEIGLSFNWEFLKKTGLGNEKRNIVEKLKDAFRL